MLLILEKNIQNLKQNIIIYTTKKTNTNKRDLFKKYNDILWKDIIHNTFNIINNNTIKLTEKSNLEELNIFENYQENQDNIIKNVMKKKEKIL